jgi:hypothetical protein
VIGWPVRLRIDGNRVDYFSSFWSRANRDLAAKMGDILILERLNFFDNSYSLVSYLRLVTILAIVLFRILPILRPTNRGEIFNEVPEKIRAR